MDAATVCGKKMENLMSEKRPRHMCERIALSVVTLRARYRLILLFPTPSSPSSFLQCVGDVSVDPFLVEVFSYPVKWHAILRSRFAFKLGQQKPHFLREKEEKRSILFATGEGQRQRKQIVHLSLLPWFRTCGTHFCCP